MRITKANLRRLVKLGYLVRVGKNPTVFENPNSVVTLGFLSDEGMTLARGELVVEHHREILGRWTQLSRVHA